MNSRCTSSPLPLWRKLSAHQRPFCAGGPTRIQGDGCVFGDSKTLKPVKRLMDGEKSHANCHYFAGLRFLTVGLLMLGAAYPVKGEDPGPWHGKKCAVALTYDDALNVHLDDVIPLLDSLGFKGTFYVTGNFPGFKYRLKDWASAASRGHDLGNHTLFHPCNGKLPGREWVKHDYDLADYSVSRMVDEIQTANTLLEAVDGKTRRTFAYPCGDMKAGDSSYVDEVKNDFTGARGVQAKFETMDSVDLYDVGSFMINGQSAEELKRMVREAMANNALLVFLFHGVGGEHSINVASSDHRALLRFLKENETDIWVAPLVDIAEYIKETRTSHSRN
jgi:peptidoglycan/xylan/chitin deacetylase (PgdA/CDA1 family)